MITKRPVMRAELVAPVVTRPAVWKVYPLKRRAPHTAASLQTATPRGNASRLRPKPPIRNLQATNEIGGKEATASLMTTKVEPNKNAATVMAIAARVVRRI